MVELVDTQVSKTCGGNLMTVRLRPSAPNNKRATVLADFSSCLPAGKTGVLNGYLLKLAKTVISITIFLLKKNSKLSIIRLDIS